MSGKQVTEFNPEAVIALLNQLNQHGISIWIDGGWAVDALLGCQTRPHDDLDIVIQEKDLADLVQMLTAQGYSNIPRSDTCPWNFVLGNAGGLLIDVHVIVLDQAGNGIYGPGQNGFMYPAESLTGRGVIGGQTVDCISAKYLVAFHSGYAVDEKDFRDVSALCRRFNLELPADFDAFIKPGLMTQQADQKDA